MQVLLRGCGLFLGQLQAPAGGRNSCDSIDAGRRHHVIHLHVLTMVGTDTPAAAGTLALQQGLQ